jgi:hypothetical protein
MPVAESSQVMVFTGNVSRKIGCAPYADTVRGQRARITSADRATLAIEAYAWCEKLPPAIAAGEAAWAAAIAIAQQGSDGEETSYCGELIHTEA